MVYLWLLLLAMIPVALSIIFYILQKRTRFGNLPYMTRQIIIGVIFGLAAVCGTEFGVDIGGATANARDSAPLCAGLIFGGPAGIISGLIGGIERWFAAGWGKGTYSQIACSVSTITAGLFAASLRKHMFDDKRPTWGIGFSLGVIMEVIHMMLVFLTHLDDAGKAFEIVKMCTGPMIFANAVATGLALILVGSFSKKDENRTKLKNISQQIQVSLLGAVVVAFFVTSLFIFAFQTSTNHDKMETLMDTNIEDVFNEIKDSCDRNILYEARACADAINEDYDCNLDDLAWLYDLSEINIVDKNGLIIKSTNPDFIGFDMNSGKQSQYFMDIIKFKYTSRVQDYGPIAFYGNDESVKMKYAAYILQDEGFVQVGYDAEQFQEDIATYVADLTKNRHVDTEGYLVIADEQERIVSNLAKYSGATLSDIGFDFDAQNYYPGELYQVTLNGIKSYCKYEYDEGYFVFAVIPEAEAFKFRDMEVYTNSFMEVLVFGLLFGVIYLLVKKLVVDNIRKINSSLGEIIDGDLEVTVDVRSSDEFASLSNDINSTVDTLKRYIAEAAARIDKELAYAKDIQMSALPNLTPALKSIPNFDVYATMNTAKEVGGDFYDFYTLPGDKLAFMIADVSGKGIPAAMFMMTAKTMIKNMAETNLSIDEVITRANDHLCENNEANMFVTVWMGILDYKTGHVTYANAGHNPPLVYHKETGSFEYLRTKPGLVLAGMDGIKYKLWEMDLEPGDRIFLYTDGVTEATSNEEELYGEERLQSYINAHTADTQQEILAGVQADIDTFINGADQFDDITMVMVDFKSKE